MLTVDQGRLGRRSAARTDYKPIPAPTPHKDAKLPSLLPPSCSLHTITAPGSHSSSPAIRDTGLSLRTSSCTTFLPHPTLLPHLQGFSASTIGSITLYVHVRSRERAFRFQESVAVVDAQIPTLNSANSKRTHWPLGFAFRSTVPPTDAQD
jgi:hypothetical protein